MYGEGGAYAAWAAYLEEWSAGGNPDSAMLPPMDPHELTEDARARFGSRLSEALQRRLKRWAEDFTRGTGNARDAFAFQLVLAQARDGLRSIRALGAHPGLPEELRSRFTELVDGQVRSAQDLLERQFDQLARRPGADLRAIDERRRALRDGPLTAVSTEAPGPVADPWLPGPGTGGRRRVIPG